MTSYSSIAGKHKQIIKFGTGVIMSYVLEIVHAQMWTQKKLRSTYFSTVSVSKITITV